MLEATVLVLVLGLLGYFTLRLDSAKRLPVGESKLSPGSTPSDQGQSVPATPAVAADAGKAPVALAARAASPDPGPATNAIPVLPPLTVLDNARVVIHNYNSAFGENPVGTNPEITAALMGRNPRQIIFITAESGLRVNAGGELVDGYGTPFFFHQLSGKEMEIRSGGEDRQMWTLDDQVTR